MYSLSERDAFLLQLRLVSSTWSSMLLWRRSLPSCWLDSSGRWTIKHQHSRTCTASWS